MAETSKQFSTAELRKMRLQAMLSAKRASLMTMGPPGFTPEEPNSFRPDQIVPIASDDNPIGVSDTVRRNALATENARRMEDRFRGTGAESEWPLGMVDTISDQSPSRLPYDPSLLAAVDGGVGQGTGVDPRTRPAPPWHTGLRYPGVSPEPIQNSAPPQVSAVAPNQSGGQSSYGPGLTPAAAEERYGPGGMYGTQPLPGGLYDQQGISPATMGSPSQMNSSASALSSISAKPTKTNSEHFTDRIKLIAKRKAIIAGSVALVGGDKKAAERYEAKALANLGIYAGKYALSNLNDSDFQSKSALFKKISPFMSVSDMATVFSMGLVPDAGGFVDLYNHDTKDVWTGQPDSEEFLKKIKTGDWHKSAKGGGQPNSTLLTSKVFTRESKKKYAASGDIADLEYVDKDPVNDFGNYKDLKELRDVERNFRKEYIDSAKDYSKIVDSYGRVLAAVDLESGPGDIALIFNYMKMLDPNSVVRESEYATAENAGGVSQWVRNIWNKTLKGEKLTEDVRGQFVTATESLFREKDSTHQRLVAQYAGLANRAGIDPENVILKYAPRGEEDGQKYIQVGTRRIPLEPPSEGDPVAEPSLTLTADQFRQLQAEAEAEDLSLIEYLELKELDELKRQQQ
mgnify:CR=1 FL=1